MIFNLKSQSIKTNQNLNQRRQNLQYLYLTYLRQIQQRERQTLYHLKKITNQTVQIIQLDFNLIGKFLMVDPQKHIPRQKKQRSVKLKNKFHSRNLKFVKKSSNFLPTQKNQGSIQNIAMLQYCLQKNHQNYLF